MNGPNVGGGKKKGFLTECEGIVLTPKVRFERCRIFTRYPPDEIADFLIDLRTSDPTRFRLPSPVVSKSFLVPFNDRLWLDDDQNLAPIPPEFRQDYPEEAILPAKAGAFDIAVEDSKLLAKGKYLCREQHSRCDQATDKLTSLKRADKANIGCEPKFQNRNQTDDRAESPAVQLNASNTRADGIFGRDTGSRGSVKNVWHKIVSRLDVNERRF